VSDDLVQRLRAYERRECNCEHCRAPVEAADRIEALELRLESAEELAIEDHRWHCRRTEELEAALRTIERMCEGFDDSLIALEARRALEAKT
jgi:hypothetical protein